MKYILAVVLCILSVCTVAPAEYQEEKGVLLLGQPNFEAALSDFKYLFVNFCKLTVCVLSFLPVYIAK